MSDYYIGLISGTSMDGIDAALVSFADASLEILRTRQHTYPDALRERLIRAIGDPQNCTIDEVGQLDRAVGACFGDSAVRLLDDAGVGANAVVAIGSHGQTLRHQPEAMQPFSLQIGDPSVIAKRTGIRTVADFRGADLALGGQGAPLTPAFHEWLFHKPGVNRVVLNIGGIANITILHGDSAATTGFDTGPGNTLLDAWCRRHRSKPFDRNGDWAAGGSVIDDLLSRLLADPYFAARPPKSTGFEYFNVDWLDAAGVTGLQAQDVQATLSALSADSIAAAIQGHARDTSELLVCGGGVHNAALMHRLAANLPYVQVASSATAGLDPDWVEAVAFAWLARQTLQNRPGNLPSVTGASRAAVLGAVFSPD